MACILGHENWHLFSWQCRIQIFKLRYLHTNGYTSSGADPRGGGKETTGHLSTEGVRATSFKSQFNANILCHAMPMASGGGVNPRSSCGSEGTAANYNQMNITFSIKNNICCHAILCIMLLVISSLPSCVFMTRSKAWESTWSDTSKVENPAMPVASGGGGGRQSTDNSGGFSSNSDSQADPGGGRRKGLTCYILHAKFYILNFTFFTC